MTETIWKNGLTQTVRFTALATDYTDFTGETTGDELPGAIVVYSENRASGWVDQVIDTPVVLWNAESVAIWEAEIPPEYITLYSGNATLQVSGTGMKMITVPLTIGGSSTGADVVISSYTHDASAQTIDTGDVTLTVERVKEIRNLSKNMLIYDHRNPKANMANQLSSTGIGIQITSPGVIHYDYESSSAADEDKIMILVSSMFTGPISLTTDVEGGSP